MGEDNTKKFVYTNELCAVLGTNPNSISDWAKVFNIPFTYSKEHAIKKGGSPSRQYEVKYVPLLVYICALNSAFSRIELIKLLLDTNPELEDLWKKENKPK